MTNAHTEVLTIVTPPPIYGSTPTFLISVVPVNSMTLLSTLAVFVSPMTKDVWNPDRLVEPRPFIWEYRRPSIWMTELGGLDVMAAYDYQIILTKDGNGVLLDVEIVGIEKHQNFYILEQILSGRFLIALGRSRRAFTYTDMPIMSDAATLVAEGLQEYNEGIKLLHSRHDWSISCRP